MRLPRLSISIRLLMLTVAMVAVLVRAGHLWLATRATEARRRAYCQGVMERAFLRTAGKMEAEEKARLARGIMPPCGRAGIMIGIYKNHALYHGELRLKHEHLASRPWEPVSADRSYAEYEEQQSQLRRQYIKLLRRRPSNAGPPPSFDRWLSLRSG